MEKFTKTDRNPSLQETLLFQNRLAYLGENWTGHFEYQISIRVKFELKCLQLIILPKGNNFSLHKPCQKINNYQDNGLFETPYLAVEGSSRLRAQSNSLRLVRKNPLNMI